MEKIQELDWRCDTLIKNLLSVRKHIASRRLDSISSIGEVQLTGSTIDRLCGELAVIGRVLDTVDRVSTNTRWPGQLLSHMEASKVKKK